MDNPVRPYFFYLFWEGKDIKIERMTDTEANKLWGQGRHWIDVGLKTREEAEKKRLAYLSEASN